MGESQNATPSKMPRRKQPMQTQPQSQFDPKTESITSSTLSQGVSDKAKFLQLKRENKELRSLLKSNETLIQTNIAQIKDARSQVERLFGAILPYIHAPQSLDVEKLIDKLKRNQIEFASSSVSAEDLAKLQASIQ